jgi:uncharacterized protein YjiS (DUF1127 family)
MSILPKIDQSIATIVPVNKQDKLEDIIRRRTLLARLLERLSSWSEKREGRRVLRAMSDWQLRDIGLEPADAAKEVSKSFFWD